MVSSYDEEVKKYPNAPLIAVNAHGQLQSVRVYFLPWQGNRDPSVLCSSLKTFVSDAIQRAVAEGYRNIAFPAIGCGQFRCPIDTVIQAMIEEADHQLETHALCIRFVIQRERNDIYNVFREQIRSLKMRRTPAIIKSMSSPIGKGVIEVVEGDLTRQQVREESRFDQPLVLISFPLFSHDRLM